MKLAISLFLLALVSCTNAEAIQPPVTVINTKPIPTSTIQPPTPVSSATPTIEIPCDPFHAEFCIIEGHFILQRPIQSPGNDRVDPTYSYASTANGTREPHHGVEFPNPSGTPVYAAADGTVLFSGTDEEAVYSPWANFYGNLVVIEHKDDLFTIYAHLSKIDVRARQQILAGDKIGEVGRTGVAIGSHLHFEVRHGNAQDYFATQNPELWLIPASDANGIPLGALTMSVISEANEQVKHAEFTIQYHTDPSAPPEKSYYGVTYAAEMLQGEENAVLSELLPGDYRIALDMNGQLYERWVEVESGKLTQIVLIVK